MQRLELVPPDVGHDEPRPERLHFAREKAQTLGPRGFFASLEQHLEADANPEERRPVVESLPNRGFEPPRAEISHRLPEMPDPRKNEVACRPNPVGRARELERTAESRERPPDASEVPNAVVHDRDGHIERVPLV